MRPALQAVLCFLTVQRGLELAGGKRFQGAEPRGALDGSQIQFKNLGQFQPTVQPPARQP